MKREDSPAVCAMAGDRPTGKTIATAIMGVNLSRTDGLAQSMEVTQRFPGLRFTAQTLLPQILLTIRVRKFLGRPGRRGDRVRPVLPLELSQNVRI